MEQAADRLEREVWPVANARQFVLTFPHQVRHWLANSPELLADVVLVVTGVIQDFYEDSTLRGMDKEQVSMHQYCALSMAKRTLLRQPINAILIADRLNFLIKNKPTIQ